MIKFIVAKRNVKPGCSMSGSGGAVSTWSRVSCRRKHGHHPCPGYPAVFIISSLWRCVVSFSKYIAERGDTHHNSKKKLRTEYLNSCQDGMSSESVPRLHSLFLIDKTLGIFSKKIILPFPLGVRIGNCPASPAVGPSVTFPAFAFVVAFIPQ